MREARYDLQYRIANHDFFYFLVMAAAKGYEQIVFGVDRVKTTRWPEDLVMRRVETILMPGVALAGLSYRIGSGGDHDAGSHHLSSFVQYLKDGGKFERLKNVIPPDRRAKYTVTMRRDWRVVGRNSDERSWRRFAEQIGAFVIEDYDVDPLPLYEKLAIHAGSDMNFGINNGPVGLLTFTEIPVTIFLKQNDWPNLIKHRIPHGTKYPFCLPNQHVVWQDDTYDNLMTWFDGWLTDR